MRKLTQYELFLQEERYKYKEAPAWLKHETTVWEWMLKWTLTLEFSMIHYKTVSKQTLYRLKQIRCSRYGRYTDLSINLQNAVENVIRILGELYDDLDTSPDLWQQPYLLSELGRKRVQETDKKVWFVLRGACPEQD